MSDVHFGVVDNHQWDHTTATEKSKQTVEVSGHYLQVLSSKDKLGIKGFLYFAKLFQAVIDILS